MSNEIRRTGSQDECCGYDPYQWDDDDEPQRKVSVGICPQCGQTTLEYPNPCLLCTLREARYQANLKDPRR